MAIPKSTEFPKVVLRSLQDGNDHSLRSGEDSIARFVITEFGLSDNDLQETLITGNLVYMDRISWSLTSLVQANLVERARRGVYRITDNGRRELQNYEKIDFSYLWSLKSDISIAKEIECTSTEIECVSEDVGRENYDENLETANSPESNLSQAYENLNNVLISDLKKEVMQLTPAQFERLVIKLLLKMGYGNSVDNAGTQTSLSRDGGIDGIIKEDQLGFSNIYIQAKQWNPDHKIGRPDIQGFSGALATKAAQKGLFITTANFSSDAKDYVRNIKNNQTIVLVDGDELIRWMLKYNLGVSVVSTFDIKRIDSDFFSEDI